MGCWGLVIYAATAAVCSGKRLCTTRHLVYVFAREKNSFASVSIHRLVWGEGYFGKAFHVVVRREASLRINIKKFLQT